MVHQCTALAPYATSAPEYNIHWSASASGAVANHMTGRQDETHAMDAQARGLNHITWAMICQELRKCRLYCLHAAQRSDSACVIQSVRDSQCVTQGVSAYGFYGAHSYYGLFGHVSKFITVGARA